MTDFEDRLWKLHCKNEKCKGFFDYFGRVCFNRGINCTHCGKSSQYRGADFIRQNPAKYPLRKMASTYTEQTFPNRSGSSSVFQSMETEEVVVREAQPMPSRICCPENHSTKGLSIHEAAIAVSEGRAIGVCKKCGKELQYRIDHTYANDPNGKQYSFTVTRAVRLGTRLADDEDYEPFLLVLRDIETGKEQTLPTFWAYGQGNTQRGGQFVPLLSLEEWKRLFRQLDATFYEIDERMRGRAYELYEQRGRHDGHALEDWLQAEAELTERRSLRAAA